MPLARLALVLGGFAISLAVVGGCGEGSPPAAKTTEPASPVAVAPAITATSTLKPLIRLELIDAAALPGLGDPLPPLDGGRLIAAGPEGWFVPSRDPKYLARFQQHRDVTYPTILLRVADAAGAPAVTAENAVTFAEETDAKLRAEFAGGTAASPSVRAVAIGAFHGAEYERPAKTKANRLDRIVLTTIAGGRRCTIELHSLEGEIEKSRTAVYAVAAGLKFQERPAETP